MNNVIEFRQIKNKQTAEGEAFCLGCGFKWQAQALAGQTRLPCPECKASKGIWKFEHSPSKDQLVRQCNCGNQLFYLTPDGHMCANCGIYQTY